MAEFNEDTRVKIPATIQFMRIGYDYLSLKDIIIHHSTRIAVDVFKKHCFPARDNRRVDASVGEFICECHVFFREACHEFVA